MTACTFHGCDRPLYARGLCLGHYTQDLRGGPLKPLRGKPSAGRVTVRLSAAALKALGDEPSKRAQEVLEAWSGATTNGEQARDSDGRFSFDGKWARLCVCGHPLGVHLAATPHECDSASHKGPPCDCQKFRLRQSRPRR